VTADFWLHLAVAVGLGLLVGLEREHTESPIAGIRTFPLITVLGFLLTTLAEPYGPWLPAAGLVALAAILILGNVAMMRRQHPEPGLTTEIAALLMYAVGALLAADMTAAAVVTGGGAAVLLYWKAPMHHFVEAIGEADLRAIVRMVLLGLVIAPVLPNRSFGPYDVLNPFQIWLMVVLIEGITLGAYVVYKLVGARAGSVLSGLLGGMISSTATTVSHARETRHRPRIASTAAVVVAFASVVVFARVGIEIAVVEPSMLASAVPPLATVTAVLALAAGAAWWSARREMAALTQQDDPRVPSELGAAMAFGLLYALILLAVAFAKHHLGEDALYGVAAVSGLTDLDAITLSTAQLVRTGQVGTDLGWRLIMVGALANMVFKGAVAVALGHRRLWGRLALVFASGLATGVLVLLFWP
jgi:uncharacterized membrane protein (DUF4010 family)